MKKQEKRNVNASIAIIVSIVLITIIVSSMFIAIGRDFSKSTEDGLRSVSIGRTTAVAAYFDEANKKMAIFSSMSDVRELLKDPTNPEKQKTAQRLTSDFSSQIDGLEGLYIATPETKILTHTNPDVVGMITRKDTPSRMQLVNPLQNNPEHMLTKGVIESPASGKYVYSAYQAVFDENADFSDANHQPEILGYVGIGIYADTILAQLPNPNLRDVEHWNYYVVNMDSMDIIASTDESKTNKPLENENIKKAIESVNVAPAATKNGLTPNIISYDGNTTAVVTYGKFETAVVLEVDKSELYTMVNRTYGCLIAFVAVMVLVFVATTIITRRQEKFRIEMNRQQMQNEKIKTTLNDAITNDLLTGTKNRAAFQLDTERIFIDRDETLLFGMVSVVGLKDINVTYGNDTGDTVISKIAGYCRSIPDCEVYRTGSGEFVIVKLSKNTSEAVAEFKTEMDKLMHNLTVNYHNTPAGNMPFPCKSVIAKKSKNINAAVITIMKANLDGNDAQFIDLDMA